MLVVIDEPFGDNWPLTPQPEFRIRSQNPKPQPQPQFGVKGEHPPPGGS